MPYSHPISSYIGNFSIAFPYILASLVIVFFVSLVRISPKSLIICLLGIVCSIPNLLRTFSFSPEIETKNTEKSISLLSYNVHFFNFFKPDNAMDYIKYCDADIICIQEFTCSRELMDKFSLAAIRLSLYKYPYSHIEFLGGNKNMKKGIATFSKYPIIKKEKIDLSSSNHGAINSYIKIKKDTLQVINCYLESNRLTTEDKDITKWEKENDPIKNIYNKLSRAANERRKQADLVVSKKNENIPSIVCGDMNDVPSSYVYRRLRGDYEDAFLSLGKGLGNTFHEGIYNFRIDYIFFNNFVEPHLFSVDKIEKSDHYPILFKFEL
jgi:endonuclease/exonuclease/phosphatase family metal-dependent hydrolase